MVEEADKTKVPAETTTSPPPEKKEEPKDGEKAAVTAKDQEPAYDAKKEIESFKAEHTAYMAKHDKTLEELAKEISIIKDTLNAYATEGDTAATTAASTGAPGEPKSEPDTHETDATHAKAMTEELAKHGKAIEAIAKKIGSVEETVLNIAKHGVKRTLQSGSNNQTIDPVRDEAEAALSRLGMV